MLAAPGEKETGRIGYQTHNSPSHTRLYSIDCQNRVECVHVKCRVATTEDRIECVSRCGVVSVTLNSSSERETLPAAGVVDDEERGREGGSFFLALRQPLCHVDTDTRRDRQAQVTSCECCLYH